MIESVTLESTPTGDMDEAPESLSHLHSLGRGVVVVVVRLVVLVPVVTRLDTVEVARFSGAELVVPPVRLRKRNTAAFRPRGGGEKGGTGRHMRHTDVRYISQ